MMMTEHTHGALSATGLCKAYQRKGESPTPVLSNCDFELEPGRLTVIMGMSGCGKSTLAHILAGYLPPDAGALSLDGQPIEGPSPERLMVFQETALWPWMTVLDNVLFGPTVRGSLSKAEARQQASQLLEQFGLIDFQHKYPGQLSGGMKRRAEIAQALMSRPKVMILDEPFRGLDVMTRDLMQEYYLTVFEETKLTTLFITSELEEAIFLADRILIMGGLPSRIVRTIEVPLPRPRTFDMLTSPAYLEVKREALDVLYREAGELPAS